MKAVILILCTMLALTACQKNNHDAGSDNRNSGNSGSNNQSGKKNGNPAEQSGHSNKAAPLKSPNPYTQKSLYGVEWQMEFNAGVFTFNFSQDSVIYTSYCDNGLVASAYSPIQVSGNTISILQADSQTVEDGSAWCSAELKPHSGKYEIRNGLLYLDGQGPLYPSLSQ